MASIKPYNLKSGALRYEVYISNGLNPGTGRQRKIHKSGFKSFEEADKWAKITEGKIAADDYLKSNPQKMTIEEFFNDWIEEHKKSVKEGTRIVHRGNIRMYITPYIGKYQLDKYKRSDHQKFINMLASKEGLGLNKKGLSVTTLKSVNATISNGYKKAIQLEYVKNNPTSFVDFPTKEEKKALQFYNFEQAEKFLEQSKKEQMPVWYPFFLLIFDAGMRKAEILGLEWQHIDFSSSKITIEQQRLGAAEKGENVGRIIIDRPKTPAGERVIPMTNRIKMALLEYRNIVLKKFGQLPSLKNGSSFIFINTKGQNKSFPIKDRTVNGAFTRIAKKAELPHIKVHDGRHTFAARLRQAGLPLEDIKDLLGHKEIETTQIYAHISPEVQERSIDKFENYILEQQKKHSNQ